LSLFACPSHRRTLPDRYTAIADDPTHEPTEGTQPSVVTEIENAITELTAAATWAFFWWNSTSPSSFFREIRFRDAVTG
jgi:hypothetical protein